MEMVTITRDEYVRLQDAAEMLDDIAAFDAAMANRAEGLPHEFMKRLIEGEAPLRVFRDWRGLTQSALARESGVNRVQVANIESSTNTGSVATLRKLADALDVSLDDLV